MTNGSLTPLDEVNLQTHDWQYLGDSPGNNLHPELILFREHYVEITRSTADHPLPQGRYPDALIPFIDPYTGQAIQSAQYSAADQSIEGTTSQGFWVDIQVGQDVEPGDYLTAIDILAGDRYITGISLKITVLKS